MRYDDSPDLFGCGVGHGTSAEIRCDWCGTLYNEGADADNEDEVPGEDVRFTVFAGKTVCECCFEKIERAVLLRMRDILPWYRKILDAHRADLDTRNQEMMAVGAP